MVGLTGRREWGISNRVVSKSTIPSHGSSTELPVFQAEVSDHVSDARHRARQILSGEAHLGDVDDWRQALISARDGLILVWVIWVGMRGMGVTDHAGRILVSAGLGISLYLGMTTAIATRLRLRYYESELDRERREIRDRPEHEREEVRTLYAAKGFQGALLERVTDVLCADDDRLLKLMMEEELGLFIHHINHPLLVGVWNGLGAAGATLLLATPICFQMPISTEVWMPSSVAILLVALAVTSARVTHRGVVPVMASWLAAAGLTGGFTYFAAEFLAGRP